MPLSSPRRSKYHGPKASLAHESDSANGTRSRKLSSLLDGLNAKIDGQSLAKDVVARALRRRSMRLDDNERPLRLLFAGPSGVGKTAMATALCESLLGSCIPDRNFKRFNLSEFSHPSKFNRLTGGDPNYVGYKEGGELTNFIRNAEERRAKRASAVTHTSCVLLLDEVDRAAEGLLTFLMNFLDQGQLTSGAGEMVDATRAVVIMTTNCGRDAIASAGGGSTADPGFGAIHEMQVSAGGAALRRGGAAAEGRGGEGRGGEGRGGAAAGGGGPLDTFSPRNAFGGSGGSMWMRAMPRGGSPLLRRSRLTCCATSATAVTRISADLERSSPSCRCSRRGGATWSSGSFAA